MSPFVHSGVYFYFLRMGLKQWGQDMGQQPKHLICTPGSRVQVKDQEPAAFHRSCRRLTGSLSTRHQHGSRMTCPTQKVCGLNLGRFSHPVCIWGSWSMQRTLPEAMLQRGMEALLMKVYLRSRGQGRQVLPLWQARSLSGSQFPPAT